MTLLALETSGLTGRDAVWIVRPHDGSAPRASIGKTAYEAFEAAAPRLPQGATFVNTRSEYRHPKRGSTTMRHHLLDTLQDVLSERHTLYGTLRDCQGRNTELLGKNREQADEIRKLKAQVRGLNDAIGKMAEANLEESEGDGSDDGGADGVEDASDGGGADSGEVEDERDGDPLEKT